MNPFFFVYKVVRGDETRNAPQTKQYTQPPTITLMGIIKWTKKNVVHSNSRQGRKGEREGERSKGIPTNGKKLSNVY